jgi:hypothetical protein
VLRQAVQIVHALERTLAAVSFPDPTLVG